MEKVTNKEVLSRLDMKTTMLLQKTKTLKLKYFGHIKRHRIDGRRGRGRPTRRWEQDINDWMDVTTTQAGRLAELDRILFRQKVQEATSRQEISWSRRRRRHNYTADMYYGARRKDKLYCTLSEQISISHGKYLVIWISISVWNIERKTSKANISTTRMWQKFRNRIEIHARQTADQISPKGKLTPAKAQKERHLISRQNLTFNPEQLAGVPDIVTFANQIEETEEKPGEWATHNYLPRDSFPSKVKDKDVS